MFHLLAAPEPDPVFLPDPYPTVDWSTKRFKPALPNPDDCPVFSASQDPDTYKVKSSVFHSGQTYSIFTGKQPFGTMPGYHTMHGGEGGQQQERPQGPEGEREEEEESNHGTITNHCCAVISSSQI